MKLIKVDVLDGKGEIEIAVPDYIAANRIENFFGWARSVALETESVSTNKISLRQCTITDERRKEDSK